jgi:phage terminase large subunit-like protein
MLASGGGEGQGGVPQRIALLAETLADARDVMVEGESGLLAIHAGHERPEYLASRRRLEWKNGSVAYLFSAEDPDSLRGHQFTAAWCDELAKWRYPQATWDMLQFALRLGPRPRQIVTTTPRPIALLKDLLTRDGVVTDRASTMCNRANLAPAFFDAIIHRYENTRLGRQEMLAEMLEDNPDALWRREQLERISRKSHPPLERTVIAVDPPVSRGAGADACGIIAAGLAADGVAYVLEDASIQGLRPRDWAAHAVRIYHKYGADCLVAEVNQGGEMVRDVLNQVDETLSYRPVHARRGKWLRAEPVAMLYEQGWVRHANNMPELEDEMCAFTIDGRADGHSPDRLDALVWALTELKLTRAADPRVRTI